MNEDPPEHDRPEHDRTVIRPGGAPVPPAPPSEPPVEAAPRTVIAGIGAGEGAASAPQADQVEAAPRTVIAGIPASPAPPPVAPARRGDGIGIQTGDVLNHIFEVKRFIARGGMGEVFEGINVNSDERVAIKVILPALAQDANVQAMFRKEARTLTRLSHPALVQYRVLAQEPELGVFYIVTEFIDGTNLSDVLGKLSPAGDDLKGLTRRLAEGLQAAHALGAIHRDISPDNVLLEDGRLDRARIIDFGIAKDLDPGSKTIIGDGFAGKLGYVAPEQLGDYDREVGPWSDVYSLGLVIIAVAQGRNVDMGGTFVDAIDRRRKGVDTSMLPPSIRGVVDQMVVADPQQRLRSMDAVLNALATAGTAAAPSPAAAKPKAEKPSRPERAASPVRERTASSSSRLPLIAGGGAALLAVVAGGAWVLSQGAGPGPAKPAAAPSQAAAAPAVDALAAARSSVVAALPSIGCTWLDLTNATGTPAGLALSFAGVAGRPADAEAAISQAISSKGVHVAGTDFSEVAPISGSECTAIDAFRQIRADGPAHLSVPQRKFEMSVLPPDSPYAGKIGARSVINLDLADPSMDFAMYGIEPSGAISAVIPSRKAFNAMPKTGTPIADLGNGRYRLQIDADHSGWSGILLLTGKGGFSDSLMTGAHGGDWQQRFAQAAQANGWKAEMVWFKMVDEVKD